LDHINKDDGGRYEMRGRAGKMRRKGQKKTI